jgi:hypothetical protein
MRIRLAFSAGYCSMFRMSIQVEVESIAELEEALAAGAVSILLDNFSLDMMRDAVQRNAGRALCNGFGRICWNLDCKSDCTCHIRYGLFTGFEVVQAKRTKVINHDVAFC